MKVTIKITKEEDAIVSITEKEVEMYRYFSTSRSLLEDIQHIPLNYICFNPDLSEEDLIKCFKQYLYNFKMSHRRGEETK